MKTNKKLPFIILLLILLLFTFLLGCSFKFINAGAETTLRQGICIDDGKVCTSDVETDLYLEKSGSYCIFADWSGKEPLGFISAVSVTAPDGFVVLDCTGDEASIESEKMELEAGYYHVVIKALASEDELNAYCDEHDLTLSSDSKFTDYAASGTWTANYHIAIKGSNNMLAPTILFLTIAIILLGFAIALLCCKTKSSEKEKYDERQNQVRALGYKRAFFTLTIYLVVLTIIDFLQINLHIITPVVLFLGIMLAVCVLSATCVWNDAYFAMNEDPQKIKISLLLIGVANLLIGLGNSAKIGLVKNNELSFPALNLLCALLFLFLFLLFALKDLHDNKETKE